MPITEVIEDNDEFEKEKPQTRVKVVKSEMDKVLLEYACKTIAYKYEKNTFSAYELRKQYTIGLGPLFHIIMSESPIYYSLDEKADQLLVTSIGKMNILSWRLLLDTSVFKQRKSYELIDRPTIRYIFLIIVFGLMTLFLYQHLQCTRIQAKMNVYDFFEDEYDECHSKQSFIGYAAVIAFILWAFVRRTQKKREVKRNKMIRTYLFDSIVNKKKQN